MTLSKKLSPKAMAAKRRASRRVSAANAIVKASTRPGFDMAWLLDEIAAERVRFDGRLAMSVGEWTWWHGHVFAAAMKRKSKETGLAYKRLTQHVVYALYDYNNDPEFWLGVFGRIQEAHWHQDLPKTAKLPGGTRM